MDSYV